jgi:hypothetical protein
MAVAEELRVNVACSFCLRPTADVATMVAGPGVFICDSCVRACVEMIEKQANGDADAGPLGAGPEG